MVVARRFAAWWLGGVIVMAGLLLLLSWPFARATRWHTALGGGDDAWVVRNFWDGETGPDGRTFRRTQAQSGLALHGADPQALVAIELELFGSTAPTPLTTTLAIGDQLLVTLPTPPAWRRVHIALPPLMHSSATEPVSLNLVNGTYRPGPGDQRDLGVAVREVTAISVERGGMPVRWSGVYLTWLLLVIGGGLLLLPGRRAWMGGWLVSVVGLAAWTFRTPNVVAYALAPAPWLLGVATWAVLVPPALRLLRGPVLRRFGALPGWTLALGVLVVAQALLFLRLDIAGALLAGLGIWLVAAQPCAEHAAAWTRPRWLWLIILVIVGAVLRGYDLATLPFGLWRDEARHGLVALRILNEPGYHPIYVAEGRVNMPALTFYLFAAAIRLWGPVIWAMRLVAALAGTLSLVPCYLFGRRLLGQQAALLATALLAVSSWHITTSRFSFPTAFDPLFALSALALLAYALELRPGTVEQVRFGVRRVGAALAGGLCAGLAVHTYHSGRVVPIVVGLFVLLVSWRLRWRTRLLLWSSVAVGILVPLVPLGVYSLQHQGDVNNRVNEVFLFSRATLQNQAPLHVLDQTFNRHLLMFNSLGEHNGRHHAPDYPMIDWLSGLGLLLGLGALLQRGRGWRLAWLVVAVALSLMPSIFAVDGPHGLRSIGAAAFVCYLAALGCTALAEALPARLPALRGRSLKLRWAGLTLALAIAALNVRTYFVLMPTNPQVWQAFYPIQTQIGIWLQHAPPGTTFIPYGIAQNDVLRYLAAGAHYQTFDDQSTSQPLQPHDHIVMSGYDDPLVAVPQWEQAHRRALRLVGQGPLLPGLTLPSFRVYELQ